MAPSVDAADVIRRVRSDKLTYLNNRCLHDLAAAVQDTETVGRDGMIIEAGTALGGSAIVMAVLKSANRPLRVYDAFDMIPPPTDKDGDDVHRRYARITAGKSKGIGGTTYYGYRDDLLAEVTASFERYGVPPGTHHIELVKGYFDGTLHIDEPVALAHLDADWYESTMTCLQRIEPHLVTDGRLVIDDYYTWSGCKRAVEDYFRRRTGYEFVKLGRLHIGKRADARKLHWWQRTKPWPE
ncbi:MAG: asparagine synthase [Streptosporangiales bacterium]|nr:asparagine synthase [Streptosporangiales bacterium]